MTTESTLDRLERTCQEAGFIVTREGQLLPKVELAALIAAARALEAMVEAARWEPFRDTPFCRLCGPIEDGIHGEGCPVPAAQAALEALK